MNTETQLAQAASCRPPRSTVTNRRHRQHFSQGIPRVGEHGRRGDHVLRFKVEIPKKLTARQEALMRELAGEFGETEKRGLSSRKK
jgi:DnaJ-class molecular chaperone